MTSNPFLKSLWAAVYQESPTRKSVEIGSFLGPVAFATRSGDQDCFSPDGRYLPVLALDPRLANGETRWALYDFENREFTEHHARAEQGGTNNDFQWSTKDSYWVVKGTMRYRVNLKGIALDYFHLPVEYQWRTMACAGRVLQGVHGYSPAGDMVLSFLIYPEYALETGRFNLAEISRNNDPHIHIRNAVPFLGGWMFSPRDEDNRGHARYEHWCKPDGSDYHIIEPMQEDGQHSWSHQGTYTHRTSTNGLGTLVTTEPTHGDIWLYDFSGPTTFRSTLLLGQDTLQSLINTTGRWTTAEHFQNDGKCVVFSVTALKPEEFIGIYGIRLESGEVFEVAKAVDKHRPVPDGQLPRPTFHQESNRVAWVEDGKIKVVPLVKEPSKPDPPVDTWREETEKKIQELERQTANQYARIQDVEEALRNINQATYPWL